MYATGYIKYRKDHPLHTNEQGEDADDTEEEPLGNF